MSLMHNITSESNPKSASIYIRGTLKDSVCTRYYQCMFDFFLAQLFQGNGQYMNVMSNCWMRAGHLGMPMGWRARTNGMKFWDVILERGTRSDFQASAVPIHPSSEKLTCIKKLTCSVSSFEPPIFWEAFCRLLGLTPVPARMSW